LKCRYFRASNNCRVYWILLHRLIKKYFTSTTKKFKSNYFRLICWENILFIFFKIIIF
jgi:hypothetical protein